jgi:HK97 family phage major capsid protein
MEDKVIEVLDQKLTQYKDDMKKQVEAIDAKTAEQVADLNKKAEKTGETVGELLTKVNTVIANQGKLKTEAESVKDFKALMGEMLAEKHNEIVTNYKNFSHKFETKAAADMTFSNNLTGNAIASYSQTPSLRGRRKVHFRDIPGVEVVNSATGIWKYYLNNTPPGEGSFGNQTIGSQKAQIDYDWTETTVTVNTLAGFTNVARQMLRDLPFLQSFLPSELVEDYYRAEDNSFINTTMAGTSSYSTTASVYAEKCIEWIGAILSRDYNPTAIVTTAANWTTLLNTKPADYSLPGGGAVGVSPMGDVTIAGVPVLIQNGMTGTKTFVGDFSRVKVIQATGLSIASTEYEGNNFTKNLVTFRVEADVNVAVLRSDWGIYA